MPMTMRTHSNQSSGLFPCRIAAGPIKKSRRMKITGALTGSIRFELAITASCYEHIL